MKGKRKPNPKNRNHLRAVRARGRRGPRAVPVPRAERNPSIPFALASLPFDLYQRHKLAAEVVERIRGRRRRLTILDVGGAPGHLKKFLPRDRVIVLDRESCEGGAELFADGSSLPFADAGVDVVISLDTLEHLSSRKRPAFLRELSRVSGDAVLVSAPFAGAQTEEAESILQGFLRHRLKMEHRFLDEHRENGLPEREPVERTLARHVGPVVALPNGCLDRWLMLMALSFYFDLDPALAELKRQISAYYNRNYYRADNSDPAYRHLLVARRAPARPLNREGLVADAGVRTRIDFSPINALIEVTGIDLLKEAYQSIETLQERLADKDVNATQLEADKQQRQRVIDALQQEVQRRHERFEELQSEQNELEETLRDRSRRLVELGRALEKRDEESKRLQQENEAAADSVPDVSRLRSELQLAAAERVSLARQIKDRDAQIAELERRIAREESALDQVREQLSGLVEHSGNLESILERRETHVRGLTEHSENLQVLLETRRAEDEDQARGLGALTEAREKLSQLGRVLLESQGERERLTRELAARQDKLVEVERRTGGLQAEAALRARQALALEQRVSELEALREKTDEARLQLSRSLEHWRDRVTELEEHARNLAGSRQHALDEVIALRPLLEARDKRVAELDRHGQNLEDRSSRLFRQVELLQKVVETRQQTVAEVNAQAERIRTDAAKLRVELESALVARQAGIDEATTLRDDLAHARSRMQEERQAAVDLARRWKTAEQLALERDRAARGQAARAEEARALVDKQNTELSERAKRLDLQTRQLADLGRKLRAEQAAAQELDASLRETSAQLRRTAGMLEVKGVEYEELERELSDLSGRRLVRLLRFLRLA